MSNDIKVAYEQILKANIIAGNITNEFHEKTVDGILSQIEFCIEETEETYDAFQNNDAVELLDGACDMFVTVCGLLQRLEAAGFNVQKALARVNENNLSKFPSEFDFQQNPDKQPEGTEVHTSPYGHVVFKRHFDGKYMKPTDFRPVDLVSCVPEDFFGVQEAV